MPVKVKIIKKILFFCIPVFLGSCNINSSMMLKTPKDYKFSEIPVTKNDSIYKIAVNDIIDFTLYSNDGFQLVNTSSILNNNEFGVPTANGASGNNFNANNQNKIFYFVDMDGTVKFPLIGRVPLAGFTIREAERILEEKYSEFVNKPYVLFTITNKKIFIFPGEVGKVQIFNLKNNSTTLFEALASFGGIPNNGKAKRIKLIRGNLNNPEVYLFNLSTLDGAKKSLITLQANDIVYIEPRTMIQSKILTELTPYFSIISSIVLIITLGTGVLKQ